MITDEQKAWIAKYHKLVEAKQWNDLIDFIRESVNLSKEVLLSVEPEMQKALHWVDSPWRNPDTDPPPERSHILVSEYGRVEAKRYVFATQITKTRGINGWMPSPVPLPDLSFVPTGRAWPNNPDDHIMPVAEFVEIVESGGFIDYDGTGYYASASQHYEDYPARPSVIASGDVDHRFTHVAWFNK